MNLALKEAEQLQEQAKWPEALSAAKRAEGLLAGSGSDELGERVQQLRKDLEMVLRLEEIPLLSSEIKDNKFDWENADRAYAQAFANYGIDVESLPAEGAATRIRVRAGVAVALAGALDDWAFARRQKDKARGLALTALAQAADPDPWRRQVRQAVQQKDNKALAALAASPELRRQPPTSLLVLTRALRAGDLAEAEIAVLRQAQRLYPDDFWINYNLAGTLRKMGSASREEAISFYRAALAVRPRSTAPHIGLGNALLDQKKLDEAIGCYRKAIELDPKFALAYSNLGDALFAQKKLDEAIATYRKAIDIAPKYAPAYSNLGAALSEQKKLDEAVATYRKAIDIAPKYAPAYNNLGAALLAQKKTDEAIAASRKAIELDPKFAYAYYNLGSALHAQNKLDEAVAACRKAIELDPKYADAYCSLGHALNDQKKPDEAVVACRKAIELDPKNAPAYNNLGAALGAQNKLDDSVAAYRKAIELDPKYAVAYNNLGAALGAQKKLDDAVAACRKAIELDPTYAAAYANLGVALGMQNKLVEAVAALRKAIELDPKYALAYYNLGNALLSQKKTDEALAAFKKAIELDPKNAYANRFRGMALALQVLQYRDQKNAASCLAVAVEYETLKLTDGEYNAACIRAICAAVIPQDPKSPPADAARLAKEQADLAMAWLHKAVAAGFSNASHMKQDKDLDALREREDFKKLLADLENKKK